MRKRLFSILQYIIFMGGGMLLVWWQLKSMTATEKTEFNNAISNANYWLLIPIILMSLLSHLSRAMRWKLLMEPLGFKPKLKNVFAVTMIGYLVNSAIPRLGEIIKCSFLSRYEKLQVDKLVGTIIIERTFDVLCYIVFILLTVLIQVDIIGSVVKSKLRLITASNGFPVWGKLLLVVFMVILIIIFIKYLFKKHPHNKIILKINNFLKGMGEGFRSIKNLRHIKAFVLHTLFIWAMYLLQIYIGFSAMEGTANLSLKAACSVLSLATLAMIATPGGIGSFPIFVMETLLIYKVDSHHGLAFGWLIWGVSTGIVLIAGLLSLVLIPYLNRKKNEISSIHPREDILSG